MWYKINWIYVWNQKVRPSGWGGWQPWANTLFYYKFENSLLNEVTWTVDASFNW
jgi:hypothetical protein